MSKYIDKDRVLEYIVFGVVGKDITCGELKRGIESLLTIEVSDDAISLVEPERPKGEWIFNPKDAIDLMFAKPECSECGFESADGKNFCSNCGAEMRGVTKCTK